MMSCQWMVRFINRESWMGIVEWRLPIHRGLLALPLCYLLTVGASFSQDKLEDVGATAAEMAEGGWGRGRRVFFDQSTKCRNCHTVEEQSDSVGASDPVGPELQHLLHREAASVLKDIIDPSSTIHPDYPTQTVTTKDGRKLRGILSRHEDHLLVTSAAPETTRIPYTEVDTIAEERGSTMPVGLLEKLSEAERSDLLTYLITPPPSMPTDSPLKAPPVRSAEEVATALLGSQPLVEPLQPLHIVLIDGVKDHGLGEHDYPAWRRAWANLLAGAPGVEVTTAHEFPEEGQLKTADILVFFQKGSFSIRRENELDKFLKRGGGAVMIHWAVNGADRAQEFAKRIGLASWAGRIGYRHGPLTLEVSNPEHPIMRNFDRLHLYDESYWKLTGDTDQVVVLATSLEDGQVTPQMWVRDHQPGRVFVSIPGHYSWTFDDPLFRILLLRGMAWTANQPIDRFNELATPGSRMSR